MDATGWYWWAGIGLVLVLLLLAFRRSGFRVGAEAFGAKLEVEGKGGGEATRNAAAGAKPGTEPGAKPAPSEPAGPGVTARGRGNIAVGGNASGNFLAGERNRSDDGRGPG